jgi:hypothetical protein
MHSLRKTFKWVLTQQAKTGKFLYQFSTISLSEQASEQVHVTGATI